jgi:hypothetical protein
VCINPPMRRAPKVASYDVGSTARTGSVEVDIRRDGKFALVGSPVYVQTVYAAVTWREFGLSHTAQVRLLNAEREAPEAMISNYFPGKENRADWRK